jgi:FKBP-type peptidyl-prolyl cis-trans isomerase FkpA
MPHDHNVGHNGQMKISCVRLLASFSLLTLLAACGGGGNSTPTSPDQSAVPFSQSELRAGTGTEATNGNRLFVNYAGWLYSETAAENKGALFDTNVNRSGAFTFTLGTGQVIRGWDQGLVGLKVGGVRRLVIPPSLAYGASGNGPVPPNAALVFEVELLDVQ